MYQIKASAKEKLIEYLNNRDDVVNFTITHFSPEGVIQNNLTAPTELYNVLVELSPEENSYIRAVIFLPDNWNGDFCGFGNGGMAGGIPYHEITFAAGKGYAAATTDMGTSRGMQSGIDNPAVHCDFGHRATHLMSELGKKCAEAVYGFAPRNSFFKGGSTGGEQALSLAQRYPEDYDAILCGAPANNRIRLHTYFLWNFVHLKDENRNSLFDEETCRKITECAVDFAQSRGDGEPGDNFITLPRVDSKTAADFSEYVIKKLDLNEAQSTAVRAIYEGPRNPRTGERIYNGMPMGSEMYGCGILDTATKDWPPHNYPFFWALGESFDPYKFDFDKDFDTVCEKLSPQMDANDPDLMPFFARGGKLIIVSGSADPCVPYPDAYRYSQKVAETVGMETANNQFRFYLLPSVDHRAAGVGQHDITGENGESVFDILINWHFGGKAPESMIAKLHGYNDTNVVTRLIYPMPLDDSLDFKSIDN